MDTVRFPVSRFWKWVIGLVGLFVLLLIAVANLIPIDALRQYTERRINQHLTDYTVTVGRAYFNPMGLSLALDDLVLIQNANPDPPVARIEHVNARVHWTPLIKASLVGDVLIDRPRLYINLNHVKSANESETSIALKGWQDTLEADYPLKIDVFEIRNGELTYVDQDPYKPLHASEIFLHATNIRNIFSPEFVYPSPVKFEATLFDKGKLILDGHANFLQRTHVSFKGAVDLLDVDLAYFTPITERQNIFVRKGTVSAKGHMEFTPKKTEIHLTAIEFNGLDADYSHRLDTVANKHDQVQKATKAVKAVGNAGTSKIRIDVLKISQGTLGYLDRTTDPNVRIYADQIEASLKEFNNQPAQGSSQFQMSGRFMGSGPTRVTGTIRPESNNPHFSLDIAIENTEMKAMNEIFQAYGKFDIKRGEFSFFSEIGIQNNRIQGYVKPIFKNMEVADMRTPEDKNLFQKLYAGAVGAMTELLKNSPRQEVATQTDISGPLEDPSTNIAQIIVNLVRDAFFKAILAGFEREVSDGQQKE